MRNFIYSFNKNRKGIILIFLSALFVALGQLFWKCSVGILGIQLLAGFIFYSIGAILMIAAFRYGSFSALHPMLCSSYVLSIILGHFFLKESVNGFKILGIILISVGIIFIGGGDE